MKPSAGPINIFEGHVSRSLVSTGQFDEMSRLRKDWRGLKDTRECYDEQPLSYLWNAIECGVQESVACRVSHGLKRFTYFFRNVVTAEVQNVGNIFDNYDKRLRVFDVSKESAIKRRTRVFPKCIILSA